MAYTATLEDMREIYVPHWPVDVSLENLAKAGKVLGTNAIIAISELNIPAVIVAIMETEEPAQAASLIKHFICQARVAGDKLQPAQIDEYFEGQLHVVAEIFAHVIAAQYADFFASGLAKAPSPSK
tara:strand:+ start:567 stop:944 length:378 start_codon:yes stop_codon:yes gene_type:complete